MDGFELRDERPTNFLKINRNLVKEHGDKLGVYGVAVYAVLASFVGKRESEGVYPSISTVAQMVDCSENKVREAIRDLCRLGWLAYEQRQKANGGQTSHRFYLLECPIDESGASEASSDEEKRRVHDMKGEGSRHEGGGVHDVKPPPSSHEPEVEQKGSRGKEGSKDSSSSSRAPASAEHPTDEFSFLGDNEVLRSQIKSEWQELKSGQVDLPILARRHLVRKGSSLPHRRIVEHKQEYDDRKVVAAYVIAGVLADTPLPYAERILEYDFEPPTAQTDGSDQQQQPAEFVEKADGHFRAARTGAGVD